MQRYRVKKSPAVIVLAAKLTPENVDELANLSQSQIVLEGRDRPDQEGLNVKTPNGKERLHQGMYLLKVGNDFYTMASANFEQRYELVGESAPPPTPDLTDDPWDGIPRIKDVP